MARDVVCPSGLAGTIRPFKVKEGRKLGDQDLERRGLVIESLIAECWTETLDVGPYTFEKDAHGKPIVEWHLVLQGDRLFLLKELGEETYGKRYDFVRNCRYCGKRIDWSIDCAEDVDVFALPEASREKIRAGDNRFPLVFEHGDPPKKSQLWFRLITGADERVIQRVTDDSPDQLMEQALNVRIIEIEGVEDGDKLDWVKELTFKEALDLTEEFEEHDCGLETDIMIRCQSFNCRAEQLVTIPFDQDFILRSGSLRRRRRSRRRRLKRSSRSTSRKTG